MRRIVAYAAERFIEVIPEIEFPGTPTRFSQLIRSSAARAGPILPASLRRQSAVVEIYGRGPDRGSGVVPSKYIHIGGDEADRTA
ncbi:MAG: family 20 glycosylhydrolase [Alistipes onderdonkii]